MKKIKYCTSCMYPETKPDLWFNEEGKCSACINFENRAEIDWVERKQEFLQITERYKSIDGSNYDCIIPVSGGKDSTYQVIKVLQAGLNPLCVTAETDSLSELGRRNLENLKRLGVDHVNVTPNPKVRRKLSRLALREVGDIQWAEHVTIFTIPIQVAVEKNIPLIVWGENSQHEYGGPAAAAENNVLDRRWLEEFGGMLGMRVSDLIGQDGITRKDLIPYFYPSDEDLKRVGVTGIFLGYYFPWDGYNNTLLAQAYGFESYPTPTEGSLVNYENLDNYYHRIHDYFKYIKYGFGRATDQANNHIRRGRLARKDIVDFLKHNDGAYPSVYLNRSLESVLKEIDLSKEEFDEICDRFTNKKLFKTDRKGNLVRDVQGNLIKLNYDN
ncbi:flagellin modification protein, PseA [Vibrio vulnificus]|jgi:N-acetyl sugar amidotransferase|uniref:N-acetyl sugar amidotransferase n=2 Tax=Vibrio vulnificus TaxID=672 RepID=UPI000BA173EB|nr:N-acetyl sugar amidotransferase [Vibrio vulnificus]EGQ7695896.1 N-acetyl sugar amidotransferase [Vibrio vulnificus]EGQ7852422.1 N-acetyl sugar amidotransferase [Vibrio vulnificus]EGQ9313268.1 N-acetyl sugar amidotransferase [Vibrio vulnificus]EGR0394667.1 N-acetyl sugar amidotransferase [Vibrio vulnificus]EGR8991347.1 N-acetyl sugar amidotransferase [Vibrio vulnificus]